MGHQTGKDLYRKLGEKIDNLPTRSPWNDSFYQMLKALYSEDEADLLVRMPYTLANFERVCQVVKGEPAAVRQTLDGLCDKGLVTDIWADNQYQYMPSPIAIGIFEFTMMRTGEGLESGRWAHLMHEYLNSPENLFTANAGGREQVSFIRTLPHHELVDASQRVEILDYEKAAHIVEESHRLAIGLCSCRHEKSHLDEKGCDTPLETCSSFGVSADFLVRHNMARRVSPEEMLDNIARSKELKLVLTADNVQQNVGFMCHCCKDCCNVMRGITLYGCPRIIVTSNYLSEIDLEKCSGCQKCVKACPANAIEMVDIPFPAGKKKKDPLVDTDICLGCGVCGLVCHKDAVKLVLRPQRVIHPETTFERVILQAMERGTLQNQLFDNPQSVSQEMMRIIFGAFLRLPPVKRGLMSDLLRSRFLTAMKAGVKMQGKGWLLEV